MHKGIFFIVFLFFFVRGNSFSQPVSNKANIPNLKATIRIGSTNDNRPNYILVKPKYVVRNNSGLIAIADEALLEVKVYNQHGIFQYAFGGRGSGPSEFQHITTMNVSKSNGWIIVDYQNKKIVLYNSAGKFISTTPLPIDKVQWPRRLYCTPDNGYILLAWNAQKRTLFHYFDKDFKYVESFGEIPIISVANRKFENVFAETYPGEMIIDKEGVIYYVPGLYNGILFSFNDFSSKSILRSPKSYARPYEHESLSAFPQGPPPKKYHYSMFGPGYKFYARRNYIPGGLNILNGRTVVLLVVEYEEDRLKYGLDMFPLDGSEPRYYHLNLEKGTSDIWQASSGKWYMIERLNIPYVQEFELSYIEKQ